MSGQGYPTKISQDYRALSLWRSPAAAALPVAPKTTGPERMADLAGGGLKLQAWGVACLLAGTVITAIW